MSFNAVIDLWILGQTVFAPNIVSTPTPQYQRQAHFYPQSPTATSLVSPQICSPQSTGFDIGSPYTLSAKHNGLYLYLGRILRPVWMRRCVEKVLLDLRTAVVSIFSDSFRKCYIKK